MQVNKFRLTILLMLCIIIQLMINNSGVLYLDCTGVLLVILLIVSSIELRYLSLLAVLADFIGHWYLGTHLCAIIAISFVTASLDNFYRMSNVLQKNLIVCFFYVCSFIIITLIGFITHNVIFGWSNLIITTLVVCPLTLAIFYKLIGVAYSDLIY